MDLNEILTIVAIILGPVLAVQVQKHLEKKRSKNENKLYIFRTLMATRATPISIDHVKALNMIDMEFSEKVKKEKDVIRAWKSLRDHFNTFPIQQSYEDIQAYQSALSSASDKSRDYLVKLLSKMALSLGYDFDEVHIKNGCYLPIGHAEIENEQQILRKYFIEFFEGKPINMNIVSTNNESVPKN